MKMNIKTDQVLQAIYYLAVENNIKKVDINTQTIHSINIKPILSLLNDITMKNVWNNQEYDSVSSYNFSLTDKNITVEIRLQGEEEFFDYAVLWDFETDYQYY